MNWQVAKTPVMVGISLAILMTSLSAQDGMRPPHAKPVGQLYSLPYAPGETFQVGQGYLDFPTHMNEYAIDWTMPEETPLHAARAGIVIEVVDSFSKSGLTEDMKQNLKRHLLDNRSAYHAKYKEVFARAQKGDKSAMTELQSFLDDMDLQAQPDVARLIINPASAGTANEAMLIWWGLFAL